MTNDFEKANTAFLALINTKELNKDSYIRANSYLQMGHLAELTNDKKSALTYYELALKTKGHSYEASIALKARIALNRLNGLNDQSH